MPSILSHFARFQAFLLLPYIYGPIRANWDHYAPLALLASDPEDSQEKKENDIQITREAADFYLGGVENVNQVNHIMILNHK